MKDRLPISAVVFVIIIMAYLSLAVADERSRNASIQLNSGDFISTKYLKILERTHSPFAAGSGSPVNLVVVQKNEGSTEVLATMSFHEGGPSFRIDESGKIEVEDSGGVDIINYVVHAIKPTELLFGFNSFQPEKFVLVKDLQTLMRSNTVAGSYVDREGRIFDFKADGVAMTPGLTFKYTIGIDHIPYQFDYIEDSDRHEIYRFAITGCHLDIFKILDAVENQHGNDGSHSKLFASLEKVNCKK